MQKTKQQALDNLENVLQKELFKCIRCGECRTVCPVFKEIPSERYTARGKLVIAEALVKGTLEFNAHVREALENCVFCTGCASQCTSDARVDLVILAARQAFAKELGITPIKKLINFSLNQSNTTLHAGTCVGKLFQTLLFKNVPHESGLYRRFSMPFIDEKQYIPQISSTPFRSRVKFVGQDNHPTVTYFTGCMVNHIMPEIGDSVVKVLNALGINIHVPTKQGCCGMPMIVSGDRKTFRKAALRNVKALPKSGPIIVTCPSGGHMLRHGYKEILSDDLQLMPMLESIAERTMDITEYLIHHVGEEKIADIVGLGATQTATYHDPCHLRKAQQITEEPRTVLALATRSAVKELAHPESCCGLGGTYSITHVNLSKQIQAHKIQDILNTGADIVATACPGCIIQLRDGVRRWDNPTKQVKHVIQILADAID